MLDFILILISGRKIIKDLASVSDVLVENYLPGKLDSWGLGFSDLSKVFSFVFLSLCLTKKLNNVNTSFYIFVSKLTRKTRCVDNKYGLVIYRPRLSTPVV